MKFKKFFTTFALTGVLAFGTALFVCQNVGSKEVKRVNAETDVGEISMGEIRNAISDSINMYLLPTQDYSLPTSWDIPYVAVGEEDGVFVDGVKVQGASLKYVNVGSAHYNLYYGLGIAAVEGTVVEFKGTFTGTDTGTSTIYTFSIHYGAQRFADTWVNALEDYDVVSLKDANMPDFAAGAAINTDDMGSDYNYVTDPAGLPKQKGFLGLTNSTGSYAFQMNYKKTETGTGWFHVLIGGQGPLWRTGHFIDFGFLDAWANTGHAQIKEMEDDGDEGESANWTATTIQETGAIALGWNVGETNLLEMGSIKVRNSSQHYIFFKVNGVLKFGEYWTLAEGGMTTKVTLQYAGTDASVTNSLEPAASKLHFSSFVSDKKQIYFSTDSDICPAVNNWDDYFKSAELTGLKLNSTVFGNDNWNYFKKTGTQMFFLDLAGAGAGTIVQGDILHISGMFRTAKTVNGVSVLYKANFAESHFQFDGETWHEVNPDYLVDDFAIDLLKLTLPICQNSGDNHDALASLWTTLASVDYFGGLVLVEKAKFVGATADSTIVVPTTDSEIEAMDYDDLLAAAAYRYDYCTAKYNLTNFAGRTLSVSFGSSSLLKSTINETSLTVIVIVVSLVSLTAGCFFLLRKKKHQ